MRKSTLLGAALLLGVAIQATEAKAQSAGDIVVNAGWFHLAPQDASRPLTAHFLGQSVTDTNSGATIGNSNTFGLTLNYFVTNNISIESVLGVPPKIKLYGQGDLSRLGELGSAREWSPSLIAKYWFGKPTNAFRPFLGVGVSYIRFSDVQLTSSMANGSFLPSALLRGPTTVSLSNAFAPVFNAGMSYQISKHWSVGASVSYLLFSTDATLTTQSPIAAVGKTRSETRLRVNPIVTFLSVGYKF